jgi:hypothetical protein
MSSALFDTLKLLEKDHWHFVLWRNRPDAITIFVTFPEERVEIDVFEDGHLELSRFRGDESIEGGKDLFLKILDEMRDPSTVPSS